MTKNEAIEIVNAKFPDCCVGKVTESDKYFLVEVIPKEYTETSIIPVVYCDDGLKAVDKETRQIFTYNPIRHK